MDQRERESMVLAEARSIWGRRAAERRAEALSPERRREIASTAGKAAAARMSPEARRARAKAAAQARWSGVTVSRILALSSSRPALESR
jgi:hypothetical protein